MKTTTSVKIAGLAGVLLLACATTAMADNYHYHEVITASGTDWRTEWTGYPHHAGVPAGYDAYDPAALGRSMVDVVYKDGEFKSGVVAGSQGSTGGNPDFAPKQWTDTSLTWTHHFNEDPNAEKIRWVKFEFDIDVTQADGTVNPFTITNYDPAWDSAADWAYAQSQPDKYGELETKNGHGDTIVYKYRLFDFSGLPIADYIDVDIFLPGGTNEVGVTFSSIAYGNGVSFTVNRSEFIVDYVPVGGTPVPEPTTMLLFGSGLVGAAGTMRRKRG